MDPGELLFARVLMPDFLAGKGPTQWDIRDPDRVGVQLREGLKGYLRGHKGQPPKTDTTWAFEIPAQVPPEAFGSVSRLPLETIISFTLAAQRALAYLQHLVPLRTLPGLATRTADLTDAEKARVRRAAQAIEDPVGCLAAPGALSIDHVEAIRAVYPQLYGELGKAVGEAIQTLRRPLRADEETSLSRLLGVPLQGIAVLQGADQTQAGRRSPGPPTGPERLERLETPVQRIADK